MTRGERIAWIWVWTTATLIVVTLGFVALQYWSLPVAHYYAYLCNREDKAIATKPCERLLAFAPAPAELKSASLRQLARFARNDGKDDVAIRHLTTLIQSGAASAEDWNSRGLSHYTLRDFHKAAADFQMAAQTAGSEGTYWSNIGDAQSESGEYAAAINNYTTAMRKGYDNAEIRGNRGWARYQLDALDLSLIHI